MSKIQTLADLGWQPYFQQQLSLEEWERFTPGRVMEQHKTVVTLATEMGEFNLPILHSWPQLTVGDWVLINEARQLLRLLERKTCFSRRAAGNKAQLQLISANVDTAFILCSMNEDFNLNRIERLLAVVNDAGAEPVLLLSKQDLCDAPEHLITQAQAVDPLLQVEAINCLDKSAGERLMPWLKTGKTVAVLGSSGVGKSSLVNTLVGEARQLTHAAREDDNKGRHTTTRRSLMRLPNGGLVLDTPGMREIQLADCQQGIATTFKDIEELREHCRFNDCSHQNEPGCAVRDALAKGELEPRRLEHYLKLVKEDAYNSTSIAERRAKNKALGKFYKRTLADAHHLKGRD